MIIGNGDIASALKDREDITFFASGVSNSRGGLLCDFQREINLLLSQPRNKHLVYFGSLCIYYSNSEYAIHKRGMEGIVTRNFPGYTIVRIGNITWGTNPNTLLNYLRLHPTAERRDEIRHLVDKEEFLYWMDKIVPGRNDIMNIPGRMVNVKDLEVK